MYPEREKHPSAEEFVRAQMANPDEASAKGNWSDPNFLNNLIDLNPSLKHTQFADFHGHGWVFRAVYKHDRKGNLLDYNGKIIPEASAAQLARGVEMPNVLKQQYRDGAVYKKPVKQRLADEAKLRDGVPMHLVDVHVEKGMHCIDCHFVQDEHGNNRLQGE